ncbi:MAG: chorismate-binding protein, partial [Chloroflexi bacterium]|nr:chorismate-binding protein [Chloroflexota bacterium]
MPPATYVPTLEQALAGRSDANLLPVYREIAADLETPVSAYLKIARGRYGFLLESVEGGERLGRYSFIGSEPRRVIRTGRRGSPASFRDPLPLLRQELERFRLGPVPDLPRFHGGAVGYLSYETARYFERLPTSRPDPLGVPEAVFLLTDTLLVFDHLRHRIKVVTHMPLDGDRAAAYRAAAVRIEALVGRLRRPLPRRIFQAGASPTSQPATINMTQEEYEARVRRVQEYIRAGDVFQAVVSLRLTRPTAAPPFNIYRALRAVNPSPY